MKNISNTVVVFLLVAFISTGVVASEVGEALILESEGGSVIYKNKKNDEWGAMLFILNDREVFSLFSTGSVESVVFEESDKSDFSSGGKYLKLNKIVRGSVSTAEGKSERAERYYCSFVEMRSGCIVKEGTGEFCGGHWGEDDGEWMAEGELTTIDVRKSGSRAALEIDTYFKNFSNRENYQRCLSQWRGAAQRVPTVQ